MNNRIILFTMCFFIICFFFFWGRGSKSIIGGEAYNQQYELKFFQQTISGKPQNNNLIIPANTNNTLVELDIDGDPSELENWKILDVSGKEMEFIYNADVLKNNDTLSGITNSLWLYKNHFDHWTVGYNSESDIGKFTFDLNNFGWIFVHGKDLIFGSIIFSAIILLYFIPYVIPGFCWVVYG